MDEFLIPTMLFWENGNSWYGSLGDARFYIEPVKQQPPEGSGQPAETQLRLELWRGPLTRALSEILETAAFPLSEEGLAQTEAWLRDRAAEINQPKK